LFPLPFRVLAVVTAAWVQVVVAPVTGQVRLPVISHLPSIEGIEGEQPVVMKNVAKTVPSFGSRDSAQL
jgi:hypothetical protein